MDFKQFESEGWGERAATYDRLIGAVTARFADPLLDAAHVTPGARVLDAACGTGVLTAIAAARGAEPLGIDLAAEMVDIAARRHPGLRFLPGDAERLEFPDRSFDAVIAGFLLHHLPDPHTATAEFARVLAPGGRLAATVWDDPSRMRLIGLVNDALAEAGADLDTRHPGRPGRVRVRRAGGLRPAARGRGLQRRRGARDRLRARRRLGRGAVGRAARRHRPHDPAGPGPAARGPQPASARR